MHILLVSAPIFTLFWGVYGAGSAVKGTGSTTRQWSCCKNSCSWPGKALVNKPVLTCDAGDNLLDNYNRRDGCESGGGSYACSDLSPFAESNDLAYGFAAVYLAASNESAWCCSCYSLTFTSGSVNGKKMIVQVTNTGFDLGEDQFNIAIPGGGEGSIQGCTKQYGGQDVWGQDYGGVPHRDDCDALPAALQAGCYWRFDWFRAADNPSVNWDKVVCPEVLSSTSGCRRNDDPIPGQNTPSPTSTTSAPISYGTVQPGGQCGGRSYKGPTRCVGGTVCTYVDENSYYCLTDPASTRTTPTTTASPSTAPTIGLPYDRCGGNGWTGPTTCKDSVCVRIDEWYSQCQSLVSTQKSSSSRSQTTARPSSASAVQPGGSSTRTRRTSTTKPAAPVATGPVQLYDQCGGQTWQGSTMCNQGLVCFKVDEYYSQCQKPS